MEFLSLADARRSLEKDQIDVIGTTVFELVLARHNSLNNVQAFYVTDFSNGGDLIVASQNIASFSDLRGKRIGIEVGSVSLYVLLRALQIHSMRAAEIEIVPTSQDVMVEDFQSGRIDAAVTYHPFSLKMLSTLGSKIIFTSKDISGEIVDVLAASSDFLTRRRDQARGLVEGFNRAVEYAYRSGTDGMAIMAARENITEAEFRDALSRDIELVPFEQQYSNYFAGGQLQKLSNQIESMLLETGQIRSSGQTKEIAVWLY